MNPRPLSQVAHQALEIALAEGTIDVARAAKAIYPRNVEASGRTSARALLSNLDCAGLLRAIPAPRRRNVTRSYEITAAGHLKLKPFAKEVA